MTKKAIVTNTSSIFSSIRQQIAIKLALIVDLLHVQRNMASNIQNNNGVCTIKKK